VKEVFAITALCSSSVFISSFQIGEKVLSTWPFLEKKCTRQNALLQHSPCKFLAWLAQQAQLLEATVWRVT
jgi:hypothetical protein